MHRLCTRTHTHNLHTDTQSTRSHCNLNQTPALSSPITLHAMLFSSISVFADCNSFVSRARMHTQSKHRRIVLPLYVSASACVHTKEHSAHYSLAHMYYFFLLHAHSRTHHCEDTSDIRASSLITLQSKLFLIASSVC